MINYQTITIDLQPDYREPVVQMYLSERDVGRPIQVNVLMQGQPYSFTAGTTVHIDLRKPSGHVVQVNGNYAVGSNVVLFNVVEQMAAEPGMCLTELSIVGDGQDPIGSKNWLTKVELSPMHAGDPSETWIEDLDELVQDAMEGHIDATLSIEGDAADAKATGDAIAAAVEQIPAVDDTLTVSGAAADAAVTGTELADLKSAISEIEPGLSDGAKVALLNCFAHVAWVDEYGQNYYDALETALYPDAYPKIIAEFDSGVNVIYTDDSLSSLKQYLVVEYFETAESEGVVVADNDYTLSGTLTEGTSSIHVSYNELSTIVTIPNVIDFYNIWTWSVSSGTLQKIVGSADPNQSDTTKYPSRVMFGNTATRRTYPVTRGKAPYYNKNETAVPSLYYPVPIPLSANHVKISMSPGQFIFMHTVPFDAGNTQYLNTVAANRIMWTELSNGYIEKDIVRSDANQLFMLLNSKYDSAGTSYPVEPVNMTIEFSEVS